MNVLQLMKQARFEADAIRQGNISSGMWQDEEVLSAANIAMDKTARLLRLSGSDILTTTLKGTDGAVDYPSEIYSPSINLVLQPDVTDYVLPPNFVRVVSLRPLTSGFEGVRFRPTSNENPTFIRVRMIPLSELASANNGDAEYWYTILGPRTLRIAPTPKDTISLELVYHYRPTKMRYSANGTIQRVNGLTTVSGTGTTWLSDGLRFPADLLTGITDINTVSLSAPYPTLGGTIASDTSLTLARPATTTDLIGQSYVLASVPRLPDEHHTWLGQLMAAIMVRKTDADLSEKLQGSLAMELLNTVTPEITLRQLQESLVTEAFGFPI